MGEQRTFSPGLKWLGERLVQAAHRTGAGGHSHQRLSDFPDLMCAGETSKHLRQCFGSLRLRASIALKDLRRELALPLSGDCEILKTPGLGHQIPCVRAIALPFSLRGAFSPRRTEALLKLLAHDSFKHDSHGTDCQVPQTVTKFLFIWHLVVRWLHFCRFPERCGTLLGDRQSSLLVLRQECNCSTLCLEYPLTFPF